MSEAQASRQGFSRAGIVTVPVASAVLAGLVGVYAFWLAVAVVPVNVDVSWLIVVGERLFDGEKLTVDVMEVNPPFSTWLYMPFVVLERLLGGRTEMWMAAGVVAAGLASTAVSCRMLAAADPIYRASRALIAVPVLAFLMLALFPAEFGQREQWALIAIMPWIALQCVRQRTVDFSAPDRAVILLAGLCAAIVVMVKPPHFALAIILPSAALAIARRSWKPLFVPENLIGASIVTAYAGWILLFEPTFLQQVLPFVRDVYLPLREPLSALLLDWPKTVLLLIVLAGVVAGGTRRLHLDAAIPLASASGFLVAFLVMGKGWPNHAWPMLALAIAGFMAQLLHEKTIMALPLPRKAAAILGGALAVQAGFALQKFALFDAPAGIERLAGTFGESIDRPTIVSLAARLQIAHPLARDMGGDFVSRYPSAWAVDNADRIARTMTDPAERQRLEALRDGLIGEFAAEIAKKQPDIVLYSNETGPRWDTLMLGDPRIVAALSHYHVLVVEPGVTVYARRTGDAG